LRYKPCIADEETIARLRSDLEGCCEQGAGLGELLQHLYASNRDLGRRNKLTRNQLEELSLLCWKLARKESNPILWGRARELWGGAKIGASGGERRFRRPDRRPSRIG
jgi:hypothetical protein